MPNETIRPPDMVGAGLYQQTPDPASLIGLLRSQGSLPAEAMSMMAPPPQQSPLASALLGGVAMMPGQTGAQQAVQMNQQQAQFQQQQQMQQAEMMERIRARKLAEEWKKTEYVDTIADSLIKSGNPEALMAGWQIRAKHAARFGVQGLTPELVQKLSRGKLSTETLNAAVLNAAAGVSDSDNIRLHPELSPQDIPFIHKLATSSDYRHKLGLRDDLDIEDHQLKRRAADLAAQKMDLSERRQDLAERRALSAEERAARNEVRADRRLDLMEKGLAQRIGTKEEKARKSIEVMEDAVNLMEATSANLDAKGYLPKGAAGPIGGLLSGNPQPAQARMNQELFANDDDWRAWKNLQASMIGFDRTILNDIGARAMMAWKNQFAFFDNPPSKVAIDKSIEQMRRLLETAKTGKIPSVEHIYLQLPDGRKAEMDWRRGDPLPPGAKLIGVKD